MNIYEKHVLPRILHCACGSKPITRQREKVVPKVSGVTLEIGVGTGLNIPFYKNSNVEKLIGLDPYSENWKIASKVKEENDVPMEFMQADGEEIPIPHGSVDTVLVTYTMCTIPNIAKAINEFKRVLKKDGKLIFCEHGVAPDKNIKKWQDRLNPIWKKCMGGCNLNRNIPELISDGGFVFDKLDQMYIPSTPKFAGYNYWGIAKVK